MSETALVKSVLQALALEPGVTAWRCNSGRRGRVTFGLGVGAADVIAIVAPLGRLCALECKVAGGTQREDQKTWQRAVQSRGGVYALVHSVDEARRAIREARRMA